jgi:prevent-host-death family protein
MARYVRAATLRNHLSDVLKDISKEKDYFIVTNRGRPVTAIVNLDFFEDLLAATSPEYLESVKEARSDYKKGRTLSHEDVFGEL